MVWNWIQGEKRISMLMLAQVKLTRFQGSLRGEIGENPGNEVNSQ